MMEKVELKGWWVLVDCWVFVVGYEGGCEIGELMEGEEVGNVLEELEVLFGLDVELELDG